MLVEATSICLTCKNEFQIVATTDEALKALQQGLYKTECSACVNAHMEYWCD